MLGTDRGAEAAVVALAVVDPGQVALDGDGILGADLLTQAAADTTDSTASGSDSALCHRVTGDDHILVRLHGNDQIAGTDSGAGHTANTKILVHNGNAVLHRDGAVLTGLGAGTVAQTAILAEIVR